MSDIFSDLVNLYSDMAAGNVFLSVTDLNQRELYQLTDSTHDMIAWYRQHSLLAVRKDCEACGREMARINDIRRNDRV